MIPKSILMPYLGTPRDQQLLRMVCRIAQAHKASLTLVHILEVPMALAVGADNVPGAEAARQALQEASAIAAKAGVNISTDIIPAREAGHAIIERAKRGGVDLVVMEARQRDYVATAPLERTVDYVLRRAPCTVWISRSWSEGLRTGQGDC